MDLPFAKDDFDSYVHRIGRTGRAGHTGLATSLYIPGFEPKIGNGPIAPLLATTLKDCGQELPAWYAALPEVRTVPTSPWNQAIMQCHAMPC